MLINTVHAKFMQSTAISWLPSPAKHRYLLRMHIVTYVSKRKMKIIQAMVSQTVVHVPLQ
jgi:hypothetical protein